MIQSLRFEPNFGQYPVPRHLLDQLASAVLPPPPPALPADYTLHTWYTLHPGHFPVDNPPPLFVSSKNVDPVRLQPSLGTLLPPFVAIRVPKY